MGRPTARRKADRATPSPVPDLNVDDLPAVMTVDELARFLRVGRSALYEAVARGLVRSLRIGRRIRIPRNAVEELLGLDSTSLAPGPGPAPSSPSSDSASNGRGS